MVLERARTGYTSDNSDNPTSPNLTQKEDFLELLQLRVLRLGFFQYWNIDIRLFPECEEGFVGRERPNTSDISIRPVQRS